MKDENYIVIQGWMLNKLKLTGNELLLFALIYGFSQNGESRYKGSLNYIMKALNVSKPTVISLKEKLKEKEYISEFKDLTGNLFCVNLKAIGLLLGSKETLPLGSKETLPNNNNNIYINSSKGKIKEISENYLLIEKIARGKKVKIETVKDKIIDFVKHSDSIDSFYNNRKELFQHFGNWMRKQPLQDVNLNFEFKYFMKMFNEASKKEFVGTDRVKKLFINAIENGFTGKQILTAIYNLYSSSEKNRWHKKTNWEFATPEHLLKDENLNKYLNADY